MCINKREFLKYSFLQILHLYGLIPVCLAICDFKFPLVINALKQFSKEHLKGLSPVFYYKLFT